jgi:hypothetical protein
VSPRGHEGRSGYPGGYYGRDYDVRRSYGRYRRYYGGGVYLGFGAPYGYAYDPYAYSPAYGYGYDPGYGYDQSYSYGPAPAPQGCAAGSYDQYGNWVADPNCSSGQPQYQAPAQGYDPNQRQYAPPPQGSNPNQRQYAPPPQGYDPNQQPYPQSQQNYDPYQSQRYNR